MISEILENIGNFFRNEVVIANASAIITGVVVVITGLIKSRKKTVISVDNSEQTKKLEEIEKENVKLEEDIKKVLEVINMMIKASKLDETTKFNANILCKGLNEDLKEKEEIEVPVETSKTVIEKLSNELNK